MRPTWLTRLRIRYAPAWTAAFIVVGLGTANPAQADPISRYYVTSGNQGTNWILEGASATPFPQQHWFIDEGFVFGEHAIAVDTVVRTLGTNAPQSGRPPSAGAEYSLDGVYTGTDFAYPLGPTTPVVFLDATTDGQYIYAVNAALDAAVWRMDLDWSNPFELFKVASNDIGITFDPSHGGSLWVSSFSQDQPIRNYSLSGAILSSFVIPTGATALARDPHDQTLWFSDGFDGTFYQYSTDGVFLSSVTYDALAGTNHLGGEFQVPEASSLLLLGIGLLGTALRRRRSR